MRYYLATKLIANAFPPKKLIGIATELLPLFLFVFKYHLTPLLEIEDFPTLT